MSGTSRIERALLDQKIDYRSHTAELSYFIKNTLPYPCAVNLQKIGGEVKAKIPLALSVYIENPKIGEVK